jgi:hypothetical protein
VTVNTLILAWERVELAELSKWCLVPMPQERATVYLTACHLTLGIARRTTARAIVEPQAYTCEAGGPCRGQQHMDLYPPRSVCGRTPICLECAAAAWRIGRGP